MEGTDVPAAKVYDVCSSADNPVGASYILVDKVKGQPPTRMNATHDHMFKVLEQLADIYVELAKHPFQAIGSLCGDSHTSLGPIVTEILASSSPDEATADLLGPFDSLKGYYTAAIKRGIYMIESGKLHPQWREDSYLIHRHLLSLSQSLPSTNTPCYLRHPDDLGSHILVDEGFNITGIIYWEWAFAVPAEVAFASPMLIWNVGRFFDGEEGLSELEEKFADTLDQKSGEMALGRYVRKGRFWQRLRWCVGADLIDEDFEAYKNIFRALRRLAGEEDMDWKLWKMWALQEYGWIGSRHTSSSC